jgi:hypothetical protein
MSTPKPAPGPDSVLSRPIFTGSVDCAAAAMAIPAVEQTIALRMNFENISIFLSLGEAFSLG